MQVDRKPEWVHRRPLVASEGQAHRRESSRWVQKRKGVIIFYYYFIACLFSKGKLKGFGFGKGSGEDLEGFWGDRKL